MRTRLAFWCTSSAVVFTTLTVLFASFTADLLLRTELCAMTLWPSWVAAEKARQHARFCWLVAIGSIFICSAFFENIEKRLDRVIAACQLDLGDTSEGSSSDSEVALRSHEHLDTPSGTRDTEVSWPDVSRAGSPTNSYPDESRRESVSDRLFSQAGRRLRRPGRWNDFVMY